MRPKLRRRARFSPLLPRLSLNGTVPNLKTVKSPLVVSAFPRKAPSRVANFRFSRSRRQRAFPLAASTVFPFPANRFICFAELTFSPASRCQLDALTFPRFRLRRFPAQRVNFFPLPLSPPPARRVNAKSPFDCKEPKGLLRRRSADNVKTRPPTLEPSFKRRIGAQFSKRRPLDENRKRAVRTPKPRSTFENRRQNRKRN